MTLKISSRADWGMPPTTFRYDMNRPDPGIAIHYPGPGRFRYSSHQACLDQVRAWDQQHRNRGSLALEYGAVICQHGYLIEARSTWQRMQARPGSNGSAYANGEAISIQFMAGTDDPPPSDQEYQWMGEAVARAVSQGCRLSVTGHRDWYATACPGDPIYNNLGTIKRYAQGGTPPPTPTPEDDDMPIVIRQGSRGRLISGGLVVKVDNFDGFDGKVPIVNVSIADMDRITNAATATDIKTIPAGTSTVSSLSSTSKASALAAFLIVVIALGVGAGLLIADQIVTVS